MTAPAYGTSGTYRAATGSTGSFAVPASVAAGDIIIVVFYLDVAGTTVTGMPTGFAHVDGSPVTAVAPFNHSLIIAGKRATGADAGTYDFTFSSSQYHEGQAHRFTGALASGTFVDTPSGTATDSASSGTTPAVSMTTAGADRLVLHCATCWAGGTWTAPSGYTKRQQGGAGLATLADLAQAVAGSTGSVTATISNADKRAAWIGALIPAASEQTITPDGTAVTVALGSPTVSQTLTVVPDGTAVTSTLGSPAVSQSFTVAPSGIATSVTLGSPTAAMAAPSFDCTVDGIAVAVTAGEPTLSFTVSPGSWETLSAIAREARVDHERNQERARNPIDCPEHGWPLERTGRGLHCMFGGHVVR